MVKIEITPKPSEVERAAIEAAIGLEQSDEPGPAWPETVLPGRDDPGGARFTDWCSARGSLGPRA